MTPERYRRVTQVFMEACDVPSGERTAFVSRACGADGDLRREVESLLRFHEPAAAAPPPSPTPGDEAPARRPAAPAPPPGRGGRRIGRRGRLRLPLGIAAAALAAAALLFGLRGRTVAVAERALKESRARALEATLDLRVERLREWAEEQKARARGVVAGDPALPGHVRELARIAGGFGSPKDARGALLSSPAYRPVVERLESVSEDLRDRGASLLSPSGVVLAAEDDRAVGGEVAPVGGAYLRRVLLGEWVVSRPYTEQRHMSAAGGPEDEAPILLVAGPVRDESDRIVGLVAFRTAADRGFAGFFSAPPPGAETEVFAFDAAGILLTEPRDTGRLRALRLLPDAPSARAALSLRLLDPGGDLARGHEPAAPPEAWPRTRMCRSAVAGSPGVDAAGYRNVRGREVIGAWTWLGDWEMGVAVEAEVEETLAPAAPVRAAFGWLLAVLAATAGILVVASSRYALHERDREDAAFGAYVLERRVGRGGMAEVFLARHATLKRPTAVKILDGDAADPRAVARFEREARLAACLAHPNTIQVFDCGRTPDGRFYYVMEFIDGLNLAQLVSLDGPLPPARAIHLLKQVAGSLEEAHAAGLVHRDVKPANIMVCRPGGLADHVKVLDFGIARPTDAAAAEVTLPNQLAGTPLYIAPERILAPQTLDPRSDIYSLGAVAFHALTGRNVFEGPGPTEVLYQVMTAEPAPPSRLRGSPLPPALEKLVLDCLAKDPDARPPSARAVLDALGSMATPDRWGQDEARAWWTANAERIGRLTEAAAGAATGPGPGPA